jgi:tripartite-type tricarboxylate transporter receptor subunit TctC
MRQMRAGKVKVLAASGDKRAADLPTVPTVTELGYPRANLVANYYIMAPAGTPKYIVDTLNAEFVKAIGDKETRERLTVAGFEPTSTTAERAASLIHDEVVRWEKIVRESGIRLE